MSCHIRPGASMADQTVAIDAAPRPEAASTVLQIAVLATLSATGTLATNILLPSLPQMAASLNVSSAAVTSAITVFLAVFALGQLVVGPISDRYGRRWPVLIGFAVFFAGSISCGLATDLPGLLGGRVMQAAGACATSVLSRAIARDLFSGADHDCDGGGARLLAVARRRARSHFRLAFRIRLCRRVRRGCRSGLWHRARRNPSFDADPAQSARHRKKLSWPDRRSPLSGSGRDRQPDHGRTIRDVFGRSPRFHRGTAVHADPAWPVLRRHGHDRVRSRHAGNKTGAALRARSLDPGRPA